MPYEVVFKVLDYSFHFSFAFKVTAPAKIYVETHLLPALFKFPGKDDITIVFINSDQPVLIKNKFFMHSAHILKAFLQG